MGETKFITAEIGVLPEGWKLIDIKSIADRNQEHSFIDGDWIEAKYIENNGIRLIQTGNIGIGHFIEKETKKYISEKTFHELNCKEVKPGDILICRLAAPIGRACIAPDLGTKAITAVDVVILKVNQNEYSREYINYYLNFEKTLQRMESFASGSTRQRISRTNLGNVLIAIPPLTEQRKIAAILSSVDEAIAKTEAIIEQTEKVKKGLMQQLLTKGIGHTKFKKTEIGEIPDSWNLVKLADVFEIVKRPVEMRDEEEYQLVTVKRRYGGVVPRERLKGKQIKVKSQFYLKHGDFLISKRQIVHGACEVVPKELEGSIVSNEYHTLLVKNGIDIDFIRWYVRLPMMQNYFLLSSVGVHIEKMLFKIEDWFKRIIALPPLEEQKQIANTLSSIEQSILKNQKYLEQLQTIKKALMQVLLTGKVRVKVDNEVMSQ
ncbi:restriction endonuclease subunit S [Anoxybacillus salavatliensis]|uniref:restriction endonuclease subunit S n=1 Tax=Anoxybacillus gonensis TaxID=198467 RepID=UPI00214CF1EF|nr:restriction endonuclease subunit S [Anoxybacillus gonensis]